MRVIRLFGILSLIAILFPALAQAEQFDITGDWKGVVAYDNRQNIPFEFEAKLAQNQDRIAGYIEEPNTFAPSQTTKLSSEVFGRMTGNGTLEFVKIYDGTGGQTHAINYKGQFVDAATIRGSWRVGRNTETFEMTRQ